MTVSISEIINGVIIAAVTGLFVWSYNIGTRVAVVEQRLHTVSQLSVDNGKKSDEIMIQINKQNSELTTLVTKQDLRINKLETIISLMVEDKVPGFNSQE